MGKKLKLVADYQGWASKEMRWTKGQVVEVNDTELHPYGDEMVTLYDYLCKRPEFEVIKPGRPPKEK